jgi:hypothetical protein
MNNPSHINQEVMNFIIKSKNNYVYVLGYYDYINSIEKFFDQLKYYQLRTL